MAESEVKETETKETETKETEKTETEKTETKKKIFSRKFIVWIVATVFQLGAFIVSVINGNADIATEFFLWWGSISVCYIGGNVAQKYVYSKEHNEK